MMIYRKKSKRKVIIILCTTAMIFLFACIHVRHVSDLAYDQRVRSCVCSYRHINPPANLNLYDSTCSYQAALRGPDQRVVSYSFYGTLNHSRGYFQGIEANAMNLPEYYPGWTMRVYHNISREDNEIHSLLCQLECRFPHLDFCNVSETPMYGNLSKWTPMAWRFLPLGDPQVDCLASRDLDSRFSDRELAAVEEWIQSGKTWHSMRDHPYHSGDPIFGGMWGASHLMRKRDLMQRVVDDLFRLPVLYYYGRDQYMLHEAVWPHYEGDSVRHDSYHCREYPSKDVRPWPTPRRNDTDWNFVGAHTANRALTQTCPIECRPKNHQNWLLC